MSGPRRDFSDLTFGTAGKERRKRKEAKTIMRTWQDKSPMHYARDVGGRSFGDNPAMIFHVSCGGCGSRLWGFCTDEAGCLHYPIRMTSGIRLEPLEPETWLD